MSERLFFVLLCNEDGLDVEELSEAKLLARITPDKDGETYYTSPIKFLTSLPEIDKGTWRGELQQTMLIIEGKIIVPESISTMKAHPEDLGRIAD